MTRRGAGFTLIEMLVALAIVSVALIAAARAGAMMIDTSGALQQRLLAEWTAQNRLSEHVARGDWPEPGSAEGASEQDGMQLTWRETVSSTPNPDFRRIEIRVFAAGDDGHVLARLAGYLSRPGGAG